MELVDLRGFSRARYTRAEGHQWMSHHFFPHLFPDITGRGWRRLIVDNQKLSRPEITSSSRAKCSVYFAAYPDCSPTAILLQMSQLVGNHVHGPRSRCCWSALSASDYSPKKEHVKHFIQGKDWNRIQASADGEKSTKSIQILNKYVKCPQLSARIMKNGSIHFSIFFFSFSLGTIRKGLLGLTWENDEHSTAPSIYLCTYKLKKDICPITSSSPEGGEKMGMREG